MTVRDSGEDKLDHRREIRDVLEYYIRGLVRYSYIVVRDTEAHETLRPTGLTFIMPFRNSTNVPLIASIKTDIN